MKTENHDTTSLQEALNHIREKRQKLEQKVTQARIESKEADAKLQAASEKLKECYTEIATLKTIKSAQEGDIYSQMHITTVESQYSGEVPALYDEGFAPYYWG